MLLLIVSEFSSALVVSPQYGLMMLAHQMLLIVVDIGHSTIANMTGDSSPIDSCELLSVPVVRYSDVSG